jgi:hypothetical protein
VSLSFATSSISRKTYQKASSTRFAFTKKAIRAFFRRGVANSELRRVGDSDGTSGSIGDLIRSLDRAEARRRDFVGLKTEAACDEAIREAIERGRVDWKIAKLIKAAVSRHFDSTQSRCAGGARGASLRDEKRVRTGHYSGNRWASIS